MLFLLAAVAGRTSMNEPKTIEEAKAIALAEYEYWRRIPDNAGPATVSISIGATAAAANIYAALCGMIPPRGEQPK